MDGTFNEKESPKITIGLKGVIGDAHQSFEAVVDTGFTGMVSMPVVKALPLGLVLFTTASFTLADGSREDTFLCFGSAILEEREEMVVIALSRGNDVLIGTELLSTFEAKLALDYGAKIFSLRIPVKRRPLSLQANPS